VWLTVPPTSGIRILHVYAGNLFGGIERLLLTVASASDHPSGARHSVALAFDGTLRRELEEIGASVTLLGNVRVSRPWTIRRARTRLRALLQRQPVDVVICHAPWSLAVFGPAVRRSGVPLVFFAHEGGFGAHWIDQWAKRIPVELIIANSDFTSVSMRTGFPRTVIERVYPPVVPSTSTVPSRRAEVRAAFGTSADAVVIIQAGRLDPMKGHATLIRALGRMANDRRWVCWQIGGVQRPEEQQYLAGLQSLAAELNVADRIQFAGHRSDVCALLHAADIYCQANAIPEGFGIAFVEALYAGLPVVTTALGPAAEVVNGSCGILTRPGRSEELADALTRLIDDRALRQRLGDAGPARAAILSDPTQQIERLVAAAQRAVEMHRGRESRTTLTPPSMAGAT
jgi:glycosyltransferase involved in cell wall biosynthesis